MNGSLRNTIALYYLLATAVLVACVFVVLYGVMFETVFAHMNADLDAESREVFHGIVVLSDTIVFTGEQEWTEKEHAQAEINPVFMQVVDPSGNVLRKTRNLRSTLLAYNPRLKGHTYFDMELLGAPVRQVQLPVLNALGRPLGYVIVALPRKDAEIILSNLRVVLYTAFPLVLIVVFSVSRYIAGKSIAPVEKVTATAERITSNNLEERIGLPSSKDELYRLTLTINNLLDRLREAVLHERQFTADASHELRTPLTAVRGTLEVLVRKPRTRKHYVEKIGHCVGEVDRMSHLVDQLLLLARHDALKTTPKPAIIDLSERVRSVVERMAPLSAARHVVVKTTTGGPAEVFADPAMVDIVIENILSNAIKYSGARGRVEIAVAPRDGGTRCAVIDHGVGISREELPRIFERFFRADESRASDIAGAGLGLAIVKRLCELQHLSINAESSSGIGTTVTIDFPPIPALS